MRPARFPDLPAALLLLALVAAPSACGSSEPGGDPREALEPLEDTLGEDPEPLPAPTGEPSTAGGDPAGEPTTGGDEPAGEEGQEGALRRVDQDAGSPGTWTTGVVRRGDELSGDGPLPLLTELRTGRHEGWDRLVLELGGRASGRPGYRVAYVDRPLHRCGSGEQVHPVGDAWLEIVLEPTDAHTEAGQATVPHRDRPLDLPALRHLYFTCDFEAQVSVVLAVPSPTPFRVLELEDPRRIVVDVRHP